MSYEVGDIARVKVAFTDVNGTPADPTSVSITIQLPDNSQALATTLPPIVRTGTGAYYYDVTITQSGTYFYRWAGNGAVMAVGEASFLVTETLLVDQPPAGVSSPGYTYNFETAPAISYVRLLVSDTAFIPGTVPPVMIFSDAEINAAYQIQRQTGWQSGMFFSGSQGRYLPSQPVSYFRVAAILLDALAANRSRLAGVLQLLDVKLQNVKDVTGALRDLAASYREVDENSGSFIIAEQTNTDWSFRDRVVKQYQRQQLGVGFGS